MTISKFSCLAIPHCFQSEVHSEKVVKPTNFCDLAGRFVMTGGFISTNFYFLAYPFWRTRFYEFLYFICLPILEPHMCHGS